MSSPQPPQEPFRVVIVGGGVAALEAVLTLRELGDERLAVTVVAPNAEFAYRPLAVGEPFSYPLARRYPLEQIAGDLGVGLHVGSFAGLDTDGQAVRTEAGERLPYDALLLALGARLHARFEHATTVDDARMDELLHGLVQDIEDGYVRRLVFVVPSGHCWPLPVYELALLCAGRAYDMNVDDMSVTIVTPEPEPLAVFGGAVSEGVRGLLEDRGVVVITSAHCEVPTAKRVLISPGSRELDADQIVALPELVGRTLPGVPQDASGFIPVDVQGRVRGLERVFAAGDATDFAIKHGGIAAQQADVAAQSIAASAGLASEPAPFRPVMQAMLLTDAKPRYLSAQVTGGHGSSAEFSQTPSWSPPETKIVARYLAPYLEGLADAAGSQR